jgi:hypothetical protein
LQFPDDQPLQTNRAEPQAVKESGAQISCTKNSRETNALAMDVVLKNHPSEEAKSEQSGESGRSTVTREEEEQDLTGRSLRANDTERGNQTADSEEHTRRRLRNRNQIRSKTQSDVDA